MENRLRDDETECLAIGVQSSLSCQPGADGAFQLGLGKILASEYRACILRSLEQPGNERGLEKA